MEQLKFRKQNFHIVTKQVQNKSVYNTSYSFSETKDHDLNTTKEHFLWF